MSRHNYSEDSDDQWGLIRWRGQVASAIRGKRGQKLLREMLTALDAMPVKELVADELQADGQYCALGVVGKARGIDMTSVDPEDSCVVAGLFDVAEPLVREITFINDWDFYHSSNPNATRFHDVRRWVVQNLKEKADAQT
jgi:hypothetical protein